MSSSVVADTWVGHDIWFKTLSATSSGFFLLLDDEPRLSDKLLRPKPLDFDNAVWMILSVVRPRVERNIFWQT